MEKDGIGTGFWLEHFGEVEVQFYPDATAYIGAYNEALVYSKMQQIAKQLIEEIKDERYKE